MAAMSRYVVVGCGYVGTRLARALLPRGPVVGVTRSGESAFALDRQGIDAVAWDLDDASAPAPRALGAPAIVFYLVPPPRDGATDSWLRHCLARLSAAPTRFVYLSSTAVYSGVHSEDVDEDTPVAPSSERGRRRLDAEQTLTSWAERQRVPWTVLRAPAIYGPGRLPYEALRRGEPMIRHSEARPASRIHVDDLVAACMLAISAPQAKNRLYNVTDGTSASMTEYFERVATLAGLPVPSLVSRDEAGQRVSPALMSFLSESRRVSGQRIRDELGFAPRFTDLRLGILSCLPAP
jgi:nucleoside-diphosphate-sugar epimerase